MPLAMPVHARAASAERAGRACSDGARCAGASATRSASASARRARSVRDQLESRRTRESVSQGRCVSIDTPLSLDVAGRDGETVSEVQKQRRWESFGEHICNLPCTGNVRDVHLADGDLLTNKVNVELDMLCSPVMY